MAEAEEQCRGEEEGEAGFVAVRSLTSLSLSLPVYGGGQQKRREGGVRWLLKVLRETQNCSGYWLVERGMNGLFCWASVWGRKSGAGC